ncbi:post-GPI attachment to proteins factor 3 [Marchantia polymorpha subsp. ruderalis]|uniref:Post-GPI attachment to proteins factor 3 n=2 Tax=Marchantia polymorpha TaxID=3197 RepID=A0A176VQQ6_MARPO|nr:hypothetical protein AXG93_531s1030 [Marchantia polymorpha subsp. ruderalis]PTQ49229.1 hypothetical protein MARPO_0003s0121 [Marchantia polymorpha]BBN16992.1 hypothetical protein Mp_7g11070 [Marchantia polymorpha subsp. ruderalis]|eukprot:PTQ49229.1 hypothetical protein MARPO_0003s0121 [Marchantia polymorpha]
MERSAVVPVLVLLSSFLVSCCVASQGDRQSTYRLCTESCEKSGCIDQVCFSNCKHPVNGVNKDGMSEEPHTPPLLAAFEEWDCKSECRYQCMMDTESKRAAIGEAPLKYHGKWAFTRMLNLQEPASVFFSVLNLLVHLQGVVSFYFLVHYKLPQRALQLGGKSPYYEFWGIWIIYGLLSINSWLWSAVFHSRDMPITEQLDYSSAIALLGYTLIVTIIRTGNLRIEAAQVMVAAPILAFITTHILYLNFYQFDYGLNMKVCVSLGIAQLLLWSGWAGLTRHPHRFKLLFVVVGTALAILLEVFDFAPVWGVLDAHALWHAVTVPLTVFWWSFIKDDARWRTSSVVNRVKATAEADSRKEK